MATIRRLSADHVDVKNFPVPTRNTSLKHNTHAAKLCFTVPDMKATMSHIKSQNVNIVNDAGTSKGNEVAAAFLGCELPGNGLDDGLWRACDGVAFVTDPDGWLIEIVDMDPEVKFLK